jgi:predicted ArsR family transcriptional regulator
VGFLTCGGFDSAAEISNNGVVKSPAAATRPGVVSRTRERVEQLLLDEGPSTANALAERLDLTTAGIRRHLDVMVADGVLIARDAPSAPWRSRGRGRPAKIYALSESGHARAPHAYDELAADAIRFLAANGGIEAFATARAAVLEDRYAGIAGTRELADALSKDGYAATVHEGPSGTQICQHHCPVANVAVQFPQMCEAETAAIGHLLGTHVQRLATIAHGDGVCTTHIPTPEHIPDDPRKGS